MILIITHPNDITTDNVVKWLRFYGYKDILRINTPARFNIVKFQLSSNGSTEVLLKANNRTFSLDEVSFFWYRNNPLVFDFINEKISNAELIHQSLKRFYELEWNKTRNFVLNELQKKPSLGNFFHNSVNKLFNLLIAKKVGFNIPDTLISEFGDVITPFIKSNELITKPINEMIRIESNKSYIDMHTSEVLIKNYYENKYSVPLLVQQKIDKWIEIRVFVFFEKFYSMAIFSQNDKQTCIDFRDYNETKGNRMVPFLLPKEIKAKILLFMKECNYNTGSIDLILSKDRKWYFLEINPTGIIEMLDCCNFNIERAIAKEIIKRKINEPEEFKRFKEN